MPKVTTKRARVHHSNPTPEKEDGDKDRLEIMMPEFISIILLYIMI